MTAHVTLDGWVCLGSERTQKTRMCSEGAEATDQLRSTPLPVLLFQTRVWFSVLKDTLHWEAGTMKGLTGARDVSDLGRQAAVKATFILVWAVRSELLCQSSDQFTSTGQVFTLGTSYSIGLMSAWIILFHYVLFYCASTNWGYQPWITGLSCLNFS